MKEGIINKVIYDLIEWKKYRQQVEYVIEWLSVDLYKKLEKDFERIRQIEDKIEKLIKEYKKQQMEKVIK